MLFLESRPIHASILIAHFVNLTFEVHTCVGIDEMAFFEGNIDKGFKLIHLQQFGV